ncbi:MAG: GIY-YIG nuclease family protein [Gammaproteobacteria bacterium]|nr:GIY-YIG nuclease family protein [Gammaproteobacteria bacterium]
MEEGYIYITKNLAFKGELVKIGRSKRHPQERKHELYNNSTGVPEPFILAFYRKTCDCNLSENKVHELLSSYRHNEKREFFSVSLDAAKEAINLSCDATEKHYGNPIPENNLVSFDVNYDEFEEVKSTIVEPDFSHIESDGEWIEIEKIKEGPIGRSSLTQEQEHRVKIFANIFKNVFPGDPRWTSPEEWVIDFTRDINPENEILLWEKMAKAFVKFTNTERLNNKETKEAFAYIQYRSQSSKKESKFQFKRRHLNKRKFKVLEGCCRWKAAPLRIVKC